MGRRKSVRRRVQQQQREDAAFNAGTERLVRGNRTSLANVVRAYERNKRKLLAER